MNIIAEFNEDEYEDEYEDKEEDTEEEFLGDCPHCRGSAMRCSHCLMTEW